MNKTTFQAFLPQHGVQFSAHKIPSGISVGESRRPEALEVVLPQKRAGISVFVERLERLELVRAP